MKIRPSVNSSIAGNRSMNCWPVNRSVFATSRDFVVNSQNVVYLLYWFLIGEKWWCITKILLFTYFSALKNDSKKYTSIGTDQISKLNKSKCISISESNIFKLHLLLLYPFPPFPTTKSQLLSFGGRIIRLNMSLNYKKK